VVSCAFSVGAASTTHLWYDNSMLSPLSQYLNCSVPLPDMVLLYVNRGIPPPSFLFDNCLFIDDVASALQHNPGVESMRRIALFFCTSSSRSLFHCMLPRVSLQMAMLFIPFFILALTFSAVLFLLVEQVNREGIGRRVPCEYA
jgi:hypothetical protein